MLIDDEEDGEIKLLTAVFLPGAQPLLCARLCKGNSKEAPWNYSVEDALTGFD